MTEDIRTLLKMVYESVKIYDIKGDILPVISDS